MKLEQFSGVNAGYVLELYDRYRQDPDSVDAETRKAFESWTPTEAAAPAGAAASAPTAADLHASVGVANLAESIRRYGHLAARLDPLGSAQIGDSTLWPKAHGITDDDLRQLPAVREQRAAFGACEHAAQPHHELAAAQALEARAPREREELLVERLRDRCHVRAHRRLRNTPTTLPRTLTWSA